MAYVNLRVLLLFLGVVMLLNLSQLILSTKRPLKMDLKDVHVPMAKEKTQKKEKQVDWFSELLKRKSSSATSTSTTTVNIETCLNTDNADDDEIEAKLCPQIPPDLGPEYQSPATTEWMLDLLAGGYFKNKKCRAHQRIAVIVPHSGPKKNLITFMHHIHPFLMKQQAEYQIFVIDNVNKSSPLSHGFLSNVGFQQALMHRTWDCVIFHEHHLVPLDSRNLYRCNWYPKQLVASTVDDENDHSTTEGGATALSPEQFSRVNGFSNHVLGRYDEYLELSKRLLAANYTLEINDLLVGKYKALAGPFHIPEYDVTTESSSKQDGLSTLCYEVKQLVYETLFTSIRVSRSEKPQLFAPAVFC